MAALPLSDADVRAILRLLSEAEDVSEFRLRHGDLVIEVRNPASRVADVQRASAALGPQEDADASATPTPD